MNNGMHMILQVTKCMGIPCQMLFAKGLSDYVLKSFFLCLVSSLSNTCNSNIMQSPLVLLSNNLTNPEVLILSFLLFRKNCHLCLRCLACLKKLLFNMMKLMLYSHNWSSILNLEVNTCLQNNCSYLCTPLAIAHGLFNYHLLAEFYLKFPSNKDFQSPIFF